jgi:DNA-binding transcriptional regulator YiaG
MERTLNNHDCLQTMERKTATSEAPYQFTDSGLPNVFLSGVTYFVCGVCERIVKVEIPAAKELMNAIAQAIVTKKSPLRGREVQFLRKRLGIKASEFAQMIDSSPEQLSRWENGHNELSGAMDRFIRMAYTFISQDKRLKTLVHKMTQEFKRWATSIHGSDSSERILATLMRNCSWSAATELIAA